MDRETVDEIKQHFSMVTTGLQEQISGLREDVQGQMIGVQGQMVDFQGQMVDFQGQMVGFQHQLADFRKEIKHDLSVVVEDLQQRIVDSSEETKRHCGVLTEDLRADMRLLAEGQGRLREDLEGLTQIVQLTHSELTGRLNDHQARLGAVERKL